jgi:23S rRNA (adenine2503-C2)-methyltransferase
MKIVAKTGDDKIATVYVGETDDGEFVEFVESVQPPYPREKKWVLSISTLYGCPVGCYICDAGFYYRGKIPADGIISQVDYLVSGRFPDGKVPAEKFKVQFARMGEPALNPAVLDVLEAFPGLYDAPGLMPSLSTVAPNGTDDFFDRLLRIKDAVYDGRFQLQFSIHTTDTRTRDRLIPINKWDFAAISDYAEAFHREGDRKVTLNFALAEGSPLDPDVLVRYFSTETFVVKITPVNPTRRAAANGTSSYLSVNETEYEIADALREAGYDVIVSIGETEENYIGSNCGQHIMNYLSGRKAVRGAYTYELRPCPPAQE